MRGRVSMWAEAYLALDFFRSFCIKCFIPHHQAGAKKTKNRVQPVPIFIG